MAKYTTELREIVKSFNIFDFDYPLFHVEHKAELEDKIIRHYYFHEIGVETIGRFLFNLETKMNEVMPYYNKLYEVAMLEYDKLTNYDMTESLTRDVIGDSSASGESSERSKSMFSDTPNGRTDLEDGKYLSSLTQGQSSGESQSVTNSKQTETQTLTRKGNIGVMSAQDLIEKEIAIYKKIGNIDMLIIEELSDLFMRVY